MVLEKRIEQSSIKSAINLYNFSYLMEALDSRVPNQISTFKLLPSAALARSRVMNLKERFKVPNGPVTVTTLDLTVTLTESRNKINKKEETRRKNQKREKMRLAK
jgi:hypothetical protein